MAEEKTAEKEEGARAFSTFITQLGDGQAHIDLTNDLHELTQDLERRAKLDGQQGIAKGSIALTIKFAVQANGVVGASYDVTTKKPRPPRQADVFWLTKGKNLSKSNPKQQELPGLREVPTGNTKSMDYDPATGEVRGV